MRHIAIALLLGALAGCGGHDGDKAGTGSAGRVIVRIANPQLGRAARVALNAAGTLLGDLNHGYTYAQ